ncbi:MAG TPA: hypothetical protein VJ890_10990 [Vineibacter sp.]|nr:hypothetical protein [Vineibacter sp.]
MATVNTQQHTSAVYVFFDDSADFDVYANDPRSASATGTDKGRPCRGILITTAGTLHTIRLDGTTVDITDSIPAGTFVPIQCKSIRAAGTCKGLVCY